MKYMKQVNRRESLNNCGIAYASEQKHTSFFSPFVCTYGARACRAQCIYATVCIRIAMM